MNITELIVECLQQGNTVELTGIGTLRSSKANARMDQASQTFYAEHTHVTFDPHTEGNRDIIRELATKECVDVKIAEAMWRNYLDALTDKLQRDGSHRFQSLGTLRLQAGVYTFEGEANSAASGVEAITDVRRYNNDNNDPFAAFDTPVEEPAPVETPAPVEETPTLEPVVEAAPVDIVTDEPTTPEPEVVAKPEATAEPEPTMPEMPERDVVKEEAPAAQPVSTTATNIPVEDIFSDIPKSEKKTKKKHRGWLWLLLMLLLCGGGYYYYTHYYTVGDKVETTDSISETPSTPRTTGELRFIDRIGMFTLNTDLLEFNAAERANSRNEILKKMHDYWMQFLNSQQYSNAMPYMQEELTNYIDRRLEELLDHEGYSPARFFPTEDYVRDYIYPSLKTMKSIHAQVRIQSELMDMEFLADMLHRVVELYGLTAPKAQPVAKKTVQQPTKPVYNAHIQKKSKQGFDIVAGVSTTNLELAKKETAHLKSLGCDAYIIDMDKLYYISMGSAPTRTAAEALMRQITSWYNGSVAIKQWEN